MFSVYSYGMFVLLALAVVIYAAFITFVSRAGGKIDSGLGAFIFNGLGAMVPLAVFTIAKTTNPKEMLPTTKNGLIFAVLAGLCVGIFSLLMLKIFQKGSLGYVMPIVYGGAIALSSVSGWALFNASINTLQVGGVLLVVAGIVLIAIGKA